MKGLNFSMKKVIILLTIIFISCGSNGESSNSSPREEESNDKLETLDWPLDYPIFEIYECLENKGLSDLPSPEVTDSEILIRFDEGYDEDFHNEFNILIDECEVKIDEDDENDNREEAAEVKEEAASEPKEADGENDEADSDID